MTQQTRLDFEPIARQVYDALLVYIPDVPIEGLFCRGQEFFIVCPSKDTATRDGKTLADWFDWSLAPAGMPIWLVDSRPPHTVELSSRSRVQVCEDFGIVRTHNEVIRDLHVSLNGSFPLLRIETVDRVLTLVVSRELTQAEFTQASTLVEVRGLPIPVEVKVVSDGEGSATGGIAPSKLSEHSLQLLPVRRMAPTAPGIVRQALDEDETFWRDEYLNVLRGQLDPSVALRRAKFDPVEACLVCTTFPPENIRAYFSMFSKLILEVPLAEQVGDTVSSLGITRKQLAELAERGDVAFVAPQSSDRYDEGFLQEILEANSASITWSRRLMAASFLEQVERNPLFTFPGTALDRRVALRLISRLEANSGAAAPLLRAMRVGLSNAWPYYEHDMHVRGAMAGIAGPLSSVASALAKELWHKDYTVELSAAALPIEWASALGASYAPFHSDGYSELAHAQFLIALQSGVERGATPIARATEFSVATDLLIVDNDTNIFDFVHEFQSGDLARFRALVRNLARPSRSVDEVSDIASMWNGQVRAYERRPDRLRSMSLVGFALGGLSKVVGAPDLVSASSFVLSALPGLLTLLNEEVIGERRSIGTLIDSINAKLANVHPDAVLLSRMRKRVGGMKDRRSSFSPWGRG